MPRSRQGSSGFDAGPTDDLLGLEDMAGATARFEKQKAPWMPPLGMHPAAESDEEPWGDDPNAQVDGLLLNASRQGQPDRR